MFPSPLAEQYRHTPCVQTRQGLEHQENYHEFCRLLGRLRSNFQLSEIVSVDNYEAWIRAVASFTVSSLQGWQLYSSSVTYLLQLWTRLVSCAAYLKSEQPNLLADLLPQIIGAYVQCRLDSVQLVAQVRPCMYCMHVRRLGARSAAGPCLR
jgi:exportin-7